MAAWRGALAGREPPLVGSQLCGVPGGERFSCQELWGREGQDYVSG